jgi:ComF family protein
LISKALSRELNLPECSKFVVRQTNTKAQSLLDKKDRRHNISAAFAVRAPDRIKGRSILLVDDIMTTGSTLEECGRMLKQAGAVRIMALVVATGRKY